MKLHKSEKILLALTLAFVICSGSIALISAAQHPEVSFSPSALQGRGADQKAGLQLISGENGDELIRVININTATAQELETLYGIGPVLAGRIIEYREEKGGFRTVEDITKVRGIGAAVYNEIWQYISVE